MGVAISVLVPVYNVEKTLDRCVQSILNQTFKDFEIILVNDGSTDNSGALCDKYSEEYESITVIHKENEGLGPTRNAGILAARGDYIYHCDSDDWLKPDLLEKAYSAITEADADVLIFGYDLFTEKDGQITPYGSVKLESAQYTGSESVKQLFVDQYFNSFAVLSAWNRMYKRSFIINNNILFPALRRCQDMAYSLLLFDKIEKLVTLNEAFYCYIIEPGVYKGRSYSEMIDIYCFIFEQTSKHFEQWGLYVDGVRQRLTNNICEQIANYSAYAFAVKFRKDWRINARQLLKDDRAKHLFNDYSNVGSRFMKMFCMAMKMKSKGLLLLVALAATRAQKRNKK